MAKEVIDAEAILNRAKPLAHQQAPEIQPYGHLVKLPIALSEKVCAMSGALRILSPGLGGLPPGRKSAAVTGSRNFS